MVKKSIPTPPKPCNSLNFHPYLILALSSDHNRDHDHGGLYRQDSASDVRSSLTSVANVCVKRSREVESEETNTMISTTNEVEEEEDDNSVNGKKKFGHTIA
ncbi:hypothetical protein Hanom_Chr07g00590831 [Helianthus anomalus]